MNKRIVLVARYNAIEPLGLLYLAGLIRDEDWECQIVLVHGDDFQPVYDIVQSWKPDVVGFQVWTGYHKAAFAACDTVKKMGVPVVIGGPHATYFYDACAGHATWVVRGGGFGLLRKLLHGELPPGSHFDVRGREEVFPLPDRSLLYRFSPEHGQSPIKSIFGSVGCPMFCTYCYAPSFNDMHGGFKLVVRDPRHIVEEAKAILKHWPLSMVYFQDDIFGFNKEWLAKLSALWREEVGVPFHCQIRLELTRGDEGSRRLDLFRDAGCTGITVAIESGDAFIRDHVLFRHMPEELIIEGCRKILDRGMTLRTEQILAVPFSNAESDLSTLRLNAVIRPTMAWTSILAPYAGTDMGTIVHRLGMYGGNNDDLAESFFDSSVLRHVAGGTRDIGEIVARLQSGPRERVLLGLRAGDTINGRTEILHDREGLVGHVSFLSPEENRQYARGVSRVQALFDWLTRVPEGDQIGLALHTCSDHDLSWAWVGDLAHKRYAARHGPHIRDRVLQGIARDMYSEVTELPSFVAENPYLFGAFQSPGKLVRAVQDAGVFASGRPLGEMLPVIGTLVRRHNFMTGLYRLDPEITPPVIV